MTCNYEGRVNVRYYSENGKYLDHGRFIYKTLPTVNEIIRPFPTTVWRVVETKIPPNDPCVEIYIKEI